MMLHGPQGVEPQRFSQVRQPAFVPIQMVICLRVLGMILHSHYHAYFHSLLLTRCLSVPVLLAPWDYFLGEQFHCAPDRGMVNQSPLVEVADKFVHLEFVL